MKLQFSGHDSFICKHFWLKKGYDFTIENKKFSDETSVVDLGVGKNMVASLRYWGKAFGILNEDDRVTDISNYLFSENGHDPYLEDFGSLWLLHYYLIKTNKASIYSFVFNEFRRERIDFTKDQLHSFLKRKCLEISPSTYNANTINTDINVFLRNYVKPHRDDKVEIEDDFSGVLIDLDLIKATKQKTEDGVVTWYKIDSDDRLDLPIEILLYTILDNYNNKSTISFRELLVGFNSPGTIFMLTAESLYNKIIELTKKYHQINYTETAGNQVLQIRTNIDPQIVLDDYYR